MNIYILIVGILLYFCIMRYTKVPNIISLIFLGTVICMSFYYNLEPKIEYFDSVKTNSILKNYMKEYEMTAGLLALSKDNQVILSLAEGYNSCDSNDTTNKITTDMVMRIASTTKPITAVGIMILEEMGKLDINEKIVPILESQNMIDTNLISDPRIYDITIKHLLYHEGGFSNAEGLNDGKIKDPQYDGIRIASSDKNIPATKYEIIKYVFTHPLNFEPGIKSEYSNFGYNILGRIIEIKSGEKYSDFIQNQIFSKLNITDAYIGSENFNNRKPNEIINCDTYEYSMFSVNTENLYPIKPSYGSFILDVMDSHGGWVMSANSLAKFGNGVVSGKILSQKYIDKLSQKSLPSDSINSYPGIGYVIQDIIIHGTKLKLLYHFGALTDGTFSLLMSIPELNIGGGAIFNHMNYYKITRMSNDLKDMMLNFVGTVMKNN